jgi:hypothetical protein
MPSSIKYETQRNADPLVLSALVQRDETGSGMGMQKPRFHDRERGFWLSLLSVGACRVLAGRR